MAVSYDSSAINPSHASVADRLRKQIKTHAVKVLREAIAEKECALSVSMLRGHVGAMAPSELIEPLVSCKAVPIDMDKSKKYIVLPAKNKTVREGNSPAPSAPKAPSRHSHSHSNSASHGHDSAHVPRSPDTAPSTPGGRCEDEELWEVRTKFWDVCEVWKSSY